MRRQIQNWLLNKSIQTWNEIGHVRKTPGLRLSETTITENLVLNFSRLAEKYPLEVYISENENANGNDLEIFVEFGNGYILFPTQAKIIKASGRYDGLAYKATSNPISQIDLLIMYAQRKKGIPLYLFYNHSSNEEEIDRIKAVTYYKFDFTFQIESLGMSVAVAHPLKFKYYSNETKKWTIPKFLDLHLHLAAPFNHIVNPDTNLKSRFNEYIKNGLVKFYTIDEIRSQNGWKNSSGPASIGSIGYVTSLPKNFDTLFNSSNEPLDIFEPKHRVIISRKKRSGIFKQD